MRRFKPGDIVVRTTDLTVDINIGDDYSATIGTKATITKLSERYLDSYDVKYTDHTKFTKKRVWEDQNCRLESKLEKALK